MSAGARKSGGTVRLCVVDRSGANHPELDILNLSVCALFTSDDLG